MSCLNEHEKMLPSERRGRFIVPIADLSASVLAYAQAAFPNSESIGPGRDGRRLTTFSLRALSAP